MSVSLYYTVMRERAISQQEKEACQIRRLMVC